MGDLAGDGKDSITMPLVWDILRNGGAERTVWETLLEMERFNYHATDILRNGGDLAGDGKIQLPCHG